MQLNRLFRIFSLIILAGINTVFAQNSQAFWSRQNTPLRSPARTWYPKSYQSFALDVDGLKNFLASTPMQKSAANHSSDFIIGLPMPDGSFHRYSIVESPVMEAALAAQFPEIKTYAGQGIDDRTATIRCDMTMFGFHGYVLSANGTIYIDPVSLNDTRNYIVYYKKEIPAELFQLNCSAKDETEIIDRINNSEVSPAAFDGQLRTYRLAVAADYEYVQYYGGTDTGALSGMTTTLNRVNGVYERDLDIHLNLIGAETSIIYTTPFDPYTNNNQPPGIILTENQDNLDVVIGPANYDIGHVFSTGAGGIASVSCVCQGDKAKGATGLSNPIGDAFDIDYVCHEMGHQFGAQHTFNAATGACSGFNRVAQSAYEPGSASTIMGYAGICNENDLQPHTDAYFHIKSLEEIVLYSQLGTGNSCAAISAGGNLAPTVIIPPSYNIPVNTSFRLSAIGTDPDGGSLTYCWEQYDKTGLNYGQSWNEQIANVNTPLFRSFFPTANNERIFPKLSSILNDTVVIGEVLPIYSRQLHFRCTVRDNNSGCGGVTYSAGSTIVNVVDEVGVGFSVTSPSARGIEWDKRKEHTIIWEVAGSASSPINTPDVNIYLSTDGGYTFPDTIAMHVPNIGSHTFSLPSWIVNTPDTFHRDNARIMIEGDGNIFFDISNHDFRIDTLDVLEPLDSSFVLKFINMNIVTDKIVYELDAPMNGQFLITINDASGKIVQKITLNKTTQKVRDKIEVPDLASGLYIIRFDGPDFTQKQKFIKARPK